MFQFPTFAYNKITLDTDGYGQKTFKKKTNLDWLPINIQWTSMVNFRSESTSFLTQDSVFPFFSPKNTTVLDLTERK